MPKYTRSRRHRKSRRNNFFGGSVLESASHTGSQVLNTMGNTADQAGTGIQNFFTDSYNKLFKKNSSSSVGSSGGSRKRRGGYSFPINPARMAQPVNFKKGGTRSKRGGYSFPINPARMAQPVNFKKGGKRSRRGGYSFPSLTQAAPTMGEPPLNSRGGRRSKRGGMYKAFSDRNYSLAGQGPPITGAKFPGTTAQPHHWVGKAQRWVGPSGNPAFLH